MIELKEFQSESAKLISDRYSYFSNHPDRPRKGITPRPFFQALSALTGAGKTPILAEAVSLIRLQVTGEPIVIWMSKAKSVVAQTFSNFSSAGKYHSIIDSYRIINIQDVRPEIISDSSRAVLILTTTGLFNNKDQSEGALNIYKRDNDLFGEVSPWERLIKRESNGKRRPMIIVYDEGHNLSEQQTDLLAELEPDAYLLASATLKLPPNFQKSVIQHIKSWVEESGNGEAFKAIGAVNESGEPDAERFITTTVNSRSVVAAQLVKNAIQFDGTTAPMEKCLDELIKRMKTVEAEIKLRDLKFRPKAIYVCRTNITDDGDRDDPSKPFEQRMAPPIRIWRYLVEEKKIDPSTIAIYADLKFVEGNKPKEMFHFSKGENDFDEFTSGNFKHIIFNLSLQEGWDDPACYLAYIDKSMGSSIQVEQVIGRVLRQFGAEHYDSPILNCAHFFLRVDNQRVFAEAIEGVKNKLQSEGAPIEITGNFAPGNNKSFKEISPRLDKIPKLHKIFVDSESASKKIADLVNDFPNFEEGTIDTTGEAHKASHLLDLDNPSEEGTSIKWKIDGHTNPVRLRWLVNMGVRSRSQRTLSVLDLTSPKFDVRVQVNSKANRLADKLSKEVVQSYFSYSDLAYESTQPFLFGTVQVPKSADKFSNGLYEQYSGFNKFELLFAKALDLEGSVWHRNPSNGGFHIPLLSEGSTGSFYPDFIVWKGKKIFCLDTKGGHLLSDAIARKLFDIKEDSVTRLQVRFITDGKQTKLAEKPTKGGFTVWKVKSGTPSPIHVNDISAAVTECLK